MNKPPSSVVPVSGYSHLHPDDQPYVGIGGVTDEQRLWHLFHLERTRRFIWKGMLASHPHAQKSWQRDINQFQALPKDR